jgi:hypothetical protein
MVKSLLLHIINTIINKFILCSDRFLNKKIEVFDRLELPIELLQLLFLQLDF